MTDFFSVFGLQPRPVIDTAVLNDLFATRSKTAHPDHVVNADFVELNEAFRTLSDPVRRIGHLLALNGNANLAEKSSPEVNRWFGPVATIVQKFDRALQPLAQENRALVRAVKIEEMQCIVSELDEISGYLSTEQERLLRELVEIDERWPTNLASVQPSLARIAADLRFLQKWLAQMGEGRLRFEELL
jgi:hypothetical protein